MKARPVVSALILSVLLVLGLAGTAQAEDTTCTGTIGATSEDNIIVPDGATCTLEGTSAIGNVIVGTGSTLVAADIDINGNIQTEGSDAVTVRASTVDGSIQIVQGGAATVAGNTLGSDVQVFEQSGAVDIRDNTIDGNLQCKENTQQPTGGNNVVQGNAEDQCASLTGTPAAGEPTPVPTEPTPGPTEPGTTTRETGRLAGADRFATAVAISASQFPTGAPTVYLARADASADALAGGILTDGPILLVPACGELPAVVAGEIQRLDPTRVVALGGTGAVCDDILTQAGNA